MTMPTDVPPAAPRRLLPEDPQLGWTRWLWLIYALPFLLEPAIRLRHGVLPAWEGTATLLALALFVASYVYGFWARGGRLLGVVGVQVLLGVAFAPVNTGAAVFFVYAGSFAGMVEPVLRARIAIVAAAASGALAGLVFGLHAWFWVPAVAMPLVIGFANLQQEQGRRSGAELQVARERVEQLAAVAERERIARDLHDVLGHTLSLVVLKAELAAKLATRDAERAAGEMRDVERVARKALQEVRETIRGYRASLPEEAERSRSLLAAAGVRAELSLEPMELGPGGAEALALALREAVTNVVRHAGATRCTVRLAGEGAEGVLRVEDDGQGAPAAEGEGLRGMRERIEAVGGTVARGTGAGGRGTRLEVRLPLAAESAGGAVVSGRGAPPAAATRA
jgi:two-component system, NarL family, sensor histidine kinase DesK